MFESNRNIKRIFNLVSSILLFGVISPSVYAEAEPSDFWCARTGSEFKTQVRYLDGSEKTFVVWSSHVEGQSPEERCRRASSQYRINHANGLKYTAPGQSVSGKPVICAVEAPTPVSYLVKCSHSNILIPLDKNDNATVIQHSLEESIRSTSTNSTEQMGKVEGTMVDRSEPRPNFRRRRDR
jgi:Circadian oscillating protein COP23